MYGVSKLKPDEKEKFTNEYEKICKGKTDVNLAILRRFEASGIRLALPMAVHWSVELGGRTDAAEIDPPKPLRRQLRALPPIPG